MIFARTKANKQTVYVGVSGGVDSSVAAKRLIEQNYKVVGAFMKTWYPDWLPCDWKSERRDAMRVCAKLVIPFVEYDLGEAYFNEVGMYLVNEYRAGRTPNPDVMCNRHVKFDAFWQAARADGADLIATGHYARKLEISNPKSQITNENNLNQDQIHMIAKAVDQDKDQTYFLWGISPDVVPNILFPIGNTTKDKIRNEAKSINLTTASKPDSQGICFLGHVDLKEFLGHYLDLEPGRVIDSDGKVVGTHDSAFIYTIGQRHGFKLDTQSTDSQAMYVINKDVEKNEITIGTNTELENQTRASAVKLLQTNWFAEPEINDNFQVRFRYRQPTFSANLQSIDTQDNSAIIKFSTPQFGIAAGQSLVIYQDDKMIGGGIIA